MAITSASNPTEISTSLVTAISEASLALSRGTFRRLARSATAIKIPTLTVAPAANTRLETVEIAEDSGTFENSGGVLEAIKARSVCSREWSEDGGDSLNWVDLASSSIGRRVDEKVFAAINTAATSTSAVLSAASMATAVSSMAAADLARCLLVVDPGQASSLLPLMDNGRVYGFEVVWSDALPAGCGGLLIDPRMMLCAASDDALSWSVDTESMAETDQIGKTVRYRLYAGCVKGIPAASFTDA